MQGETQGWFTKTTFKTCSDHGQLPAISHLEEHAASQPELGEVPTQHGELLTVHLGKEEIRRLVIQKQQL